MGIGASESKVVDACKALWPRPWTLADWHLYALDLIPIPEFTKTENYLEVPF
jgi:hypothetical protein